MDEATPHHEITEEDLADDARESALWEQPFPGYEVHERIGRGGMAAIFRATDLRFEREVAVKTLIPDLTHHEDAVERFFNEARNVARLRHENIVRGLDVGRAGKYFYFVMEYVKGETAAEKLARLERGRLPEREALHIVRAVAEALQYMFENGLVHRDIKPGNILLAQGGGVKVCDLGLAREVAFPSPEACIKGSPSYASPEQIRCDPNVDIRADLYGLGCAWYHMLLGQPPFTGQTSAEILRRHLDDEPEPPRERDPRIGAMTSQIILWLLKKDRDERPRTPQALLAKLAEHPLAQQEDSPTTETAAHEN